jgi:hypothetical protein
MIKYSLNQLNSIVTFKTDTIATLRNLTNTPNTVYVTGYHTANDNAFGSHFFKWNPTSIVPDNSGTIIAVNGIPTGRYELQYDGALNVKWFGVVGDGVTDDTNSFQNAVNFAIANDIAIEDKQGLTIRLTSTIVANRGFTLIGTPPVVKLIGGADLFNGTFLYFDHTGKGFIVGGNGTSYSTDFNFISIGTRRNQPEPVVGWAPNDHDYDFYLDDVLDVTFKDCLLLNPTRGIMACNGGGRFNVYNMRMQAFKVGINIDAVYDVCRIDQLHIWPFWRDNMNVHSYCMNGLDGIISGRNDNPIWSNIFTIFARAGIRFVNGINGITSKFHLSNCDFDRGTFGIWLDSVNWVTGQIVNYTSEGEHGFVGTKGLFVSGTSSNNTIEATNFRVNECAQNGIRIEGSNNKFSVSNLKVQNFDGSNSRFPAVEALDTNVIEILGTPNISGNISSYNIKYAPTGIIKVDEWRDFAPVVSAVKGTIDELGLVYGKYKVIGDNVHVAFYIEIKKNGNASDGVIFQAPALISNGNWTGSGRQLNDEGKVLTVIANTTSNIYIYTYDNSYPASDGTIIAGNITYGITI